MAQRITKTYTSVAADTDGLGNNVTGASFTLTANDAGDGLAHKITVLNNTANDHSAKTVAIVGTAPDGSAQSETIAGPGNAATVTTTKYFLTVTSVTPSATIGADTFDIGWAAASVTPPIPIRVKPENTASSIGISCDIADSPTYTLQQSYGGNWYDHATIATKSADFSGSITVPVLAIRLAFAAAGGVALNALVAGA